METKEIKNSEEANKEGKYIYCIAKATQKEGFDSAGIGEPGGAVTSLCCDGLAAVISDTPVKKYPVSRKNTMAHQKVMEEVYEGCTVLPVRFCTIAEDKDGRSAIDRIQEQVLIARHQEFADLIVDMSNKVELGVKVLWTDMDKVYKEIVEENSKVREMKEKIERINTLRPSQTTHGKRVELGEKVKKALEAKREGLKKVIMGVLKRLSCDSRVNKDFGDKMVVNGAFLVEKSRMEEFDAGVEKLSETYGETLKFKYVGPLPPSNFVEIVINWT